MLGSSPVMTASTDSYDTDGAIDELEKAVVRRRDDINEQWDQLSPATQLSVAEVAEYLGVSLGHVYNAIAAGHLAAIRLPGKGKGIFRVAKRDVDSYVQSCRVQATPRSIRPTTPPSDGKFFQHLQATWLSEPSPQSNADPHLQDACNARPSGSWNGPTKQRPSSNRSRP